MEQWLRCGNGNETTHGRARRVCSHCTQYFLKLYFWVNDRSVHCPHSQLMYIKYCLYTECVLLYYGHSEFSKFILTISSWRRMVILNKLRHSLHSFLFYIVLLSLFQLISGSDWLNFVRVVEILLHVIAFSCSLKRKHSWRIAVSRPVYVLISIWLFGTRMKSMSFMLYSVITVSTAYMLTY